MMPPHYLSTLVEERHRELRRLARPFEIPSTIAGLRVRLADALIRLGQVLATPDPPAPSRAISRAG
jgi:hypothetical protein